MNAREPLKEWKVTDQCVYEKKYEKEVKGFILNVKGSTGSCQIQLPKDSKQNLFLIQPFFVSQICIPRLSDFFLELTVRDVRGTRRRLFFSGNQKDISSTALHARLPLADIKPHTWTNLCIDLPSIISHCWSVSSYHSIATITFAGTFKLRKIFTVKHPPPPVSEMSVEDDYCYQHLPKACDFPAEVDHINQLISMCTFKIQKQISSAPPISSRNVKNSISSFVPPHSTNFGTSNGSVRTALSAGDKVPEPPGLGKRKGSVGRRVNLSGPCGSSDENRESLAKSSARSLESRTSKKMEVVVGKPDSGLVLTGKPAQIHIDDHLPPLETGNKSRRGSSGESIPDETVNSDKRRSIVHGVFDNEESSDVFLANLKSDVPKLPAVRKTFSLVGGCELKNNTTKEIPTKPTLIESSREEAIAFIKKSFGSDHEQVISEDEGLTLSMVVGDNKDSGPQMDSDFTGVGENDDSIYENKAATSSIIYDASRYTDEGEEEENCGNVLKNDIDQLNGLSIGDKPENEGEDETHQSINSEQSDIELLYDPVLNCYIDPKTGKYFELIS